MAGRQNAHAALLDKPAVAPSVALQKSCLQPHRGRCRPEPGTRGLAAEKHPCGWSEKQYVIGYGRALVGVHGHWQMAKFAGGINGINRTAIGKIATKNTKRHKKVQRVNRRFLCLFVFFVAIPALRFDASPLNFCQQPAE
jgi:hypothetical protein